ncbi:hypothetical protein [Streptomyces syringium]|uniref:hypothetical protein n=1 Tax=Streptomyces syringium TaxID=76729 RepID=UPI0033FBA01D
MKPTTAEPADRVLVEVRAQDPISQAGVASQLRPRPEVQLVDPGGSEDAQVVVMVLDAIDEAALRVLRQIQRSGTARGVLVTTQIDEQQLVSAAECGFVGVVRRCEATPERLVRVIGAVAGGRVCAGRSAG